MKKITLLLFSFLFCMGKIYSENLVSIGQNYPDIYYPEGTSWTEITTNLIDETYCSIDTYTIDGDTAIGSQNYKKILLNGEIYFAALREENNKVFLYFFDLKKERLAYDFAWEIGKTIYYQLIESYEYPDEYQVMAEIDKIDQVQLADGLHYDHIGGYIRGIGGKAGIFQHMLAHPTNGDQIQLLCFSRNNTLIYKNNSYLNCESCEKNSTGITESSKANPVLFFKNRFLFSFEEETEKYLVIYNTMGNKVISQNITHASSFQINDFSPGVYFYQVISEQEEVLYTGNIMRF